MKEENQEIDDNRVIHQTGKTDRNCGKCTYYIPLKTPGAGACSCEEILKLYRSMPVIVVDSHETCWCWEPEEGYFDE